MSTDPSQRPEGSKKKTSPFGSIKSEDLMSYARNNTFDTIAYAVLVLGILLLFFQPLLGQLLIGVVAGFYFSKPISRELYNFKNRVTVEPLVHSLILIGTLLGLFICAPGIFIAACLVAWIFHLFEAKKEDDFHSLN